MKKFSIRNLIFVTIIVAMACGWWVDRQALRGTIRELNRLISESHGNDPPIRAHLFRREVDPEVRLGWGL